MFAFAIWNTKEKKLFVARDRLGIKPLYYYQQGDTFIFSSEIKSILQYPTVRAKLNTQVLNSYFQYRYIIGKETLFCSIYQLPPGYSLTFQNKRLSISQYWNLPILTKKKDKGYDYYFDKTKELVKKAIKRRMISDVPLGAYLSGGLDSSIVASVMADVRGSKPLSTFSIGFKEEGFNEFDYARLVAKRWHTDHHEIMLSMKDYMDTVKHLIRYKDGPLSVPNEVPLYLMSRELKKYITVVLSGEGSDELFGGYGRIFRSYISYEKDGGSMNYCDYFLDKYQYVSTGLLNKLFNSKVNDTIQEASYTDTIFHTLFGKISAMQIEDKLPYVFQVVHLQGLLQRVDSSTMAASVEARVPFVDHELVEFVNAIPFDYKIKWNDDKLKQKAIEGNMDPQDYSEKYDTTKYILKKAMSSYIPREIIQRKKVGFPVPLDIWFKGSFEHKAHDILTNKDSRIRELLNYDYIQKKTYTKELNGMTIWMLVNMELFLQTYFD